MEHYRAIKKEETTDTCKDGGFQKHYFEQQKPYTKEHTVFDSIYMKFKNKQH